MGKPNGFVRAYLPPTNNSISLFIFAAPPFPTAALFLFDISPKLFIFHNKSVWVGRRVLHPLNRAHNAGHYFYATAKLYISFLFFPALKKPLGFQVAWKIVQNLLYSYDIPSPFWLSRSCPVIGLLYMAQVIALVPTGDAVATEWLKMFLIVFIIIVFSISHLSKQINNKKIFIWWARSDSNRQCF